MTRNVTCTIFSVRFVFLFLYLHFQMNLQKKIFVVIFSILSANVFSQDTHFRWDGAIVENHTKNSVPNAHIRVFSSGRVFVFSADNQGLTRINYFRPTEYDSILVTSIGFKPLKLSRYDLLQINEIHLEKDILFLEEVVIKPDRRIRTMRLGNTNAFALGSLNQHFEIQRVLFIPNNVEAGKILKVRYYMGGVATNRIKDFKRQNYSPFRVRLYEKDAANNTIGKDLLNDVLIVSQNKGNWLEVDVSQYDIMMPESGIFVGFEVLSIDYYLENLIISESHIEFKNHQLPNSVRFGVTKSNPKKSFEERTYTSRAGKWILNQNTQSGYNYLINIEVEKK